jgi:hypothetical protein
MEEKAAPFVCEAFCPDFGVRALKELFEQTLFSSCRPNSDKVGNVRAAAVTADTDSSANSSESEDEAGDSVEVVKKVTKNAGGNLTPAALGGQLQINRNYTVGTLQESVATSTDPILASCHSYVILYP